MTIVRATGGSGAGSGRVPYTLLPAGNGVDDRTAVQNVLNGGGEIVARAGQTLRIPASATGWSVRSNTRLIIEAGATLKLDPPTSGTTYRILNLGGDGTPVSNVTIEGEGTLLGDLDGHIGSSGEYGHLINVQNASDVRIYGPLHITKAWGDGIYVGGGTSPVNGVLVDGPQITDCRREGIAVFNATNAILRDLRITDVGLTASARGVATGPGSGIDVEPNSGDAVTGITIERCHVVRAKGPGMYISQNPGAISDLLIRGNKVVDCGLSTDIIGWAYTSNGIHVSGTTRPRLYDNEVFGAGYDGSLNGDHGGIYIRSASRPVIKGGFLRSNRSRGLYLTNTTFADIQNVTIQDNDYQGAVLYQCDDATIRGCNFFDHVSTAATTPHLMLQQSNRGDLLHNKFRSASSKGNYWVDVRDSGADNAVENNRSRGAAPTVAAYRNQGTNTTLVDNYTYGSSARVAW